MQTRQKILDIAFSAFLEEGFDEISLNEIISRTKLSKGAFYYHFKNKEELLNQIIEKYFLQHINETVNKITTKGKDTKDKLLLIAKSVAGMKPKNGFSSEYYNQKDFYTLFISALKMSPELKKCNINQDLAVRKAFTTIIEKGIETGEIDDKLQADKIANLINTTVKGTLFLWLTTEQDDIERVLSNNLLDLYELIKSQ